MRIKEGYKDDGNDDIQTPEACNIPYMRSFFGFLNDLSFFIYDLRIV